jgi:hypothetical protein
MRPLFVLLLLLQIHPAQAKEFVIQRQQQQLTVDVHFSLFGDHRDDVLAWVESTADALAGVYGRWPRDEWRIKVRPVSLFGNDPVPWAQVTRGDPDTVSFYIDAMASKEELVSNWTAYHELSHLLIPYRGWGDMWFSEGLASYYQNLLQARHGVIDEREMWQRLQDGFIRGRDNKRPDLSLEDLSPKLHENRSHMRVYWTGALYFLTADVELRRRSQGEQSLDTVLAQLNACCGDRALSVPEMVRRLDGIIDYPLFQPLYEEMTLSKQIPEFEGIYQELGIVSENEQVELVEGHPMTNIRQAIAGF